MGTQKVENNSRMSSRMRYFLSTGLLLTFFVLGCSSSFLKTDKDEELKKNDEFEKMVQIVPSEEVKNGDVPPVPVQPPVPLPNNPDEKIVKAAKDKKPKKGTGKKTDKKQAAKEVPSRRQPLLESAEGFAPGVRRPLVSPFRDGEKVVHAVRYFKVSAGELTMEVRPHKFVNGRKSYSFVTSLSSSSTFSTFYSVDDWAETLVDYETLLPSVFTLHVKETGQLREGRAFFDQAKQKAKFWQKKVTKKKGMEEIDKEFDLPAYAQNVFSAAYYMRAFKYEVGKEVAFSVGDYEQNVVCKGKALRKDVIETDAGTFNTIVVQPTFELKGVFKPVGDIFFWLTDDDRKFIVKIESEIRIGTVVSEAVSLEKGDENLP
ncbi:MAG: DUF3108 domain-containing protein [Pseudobdellovibrionaceae bacterium]